MGFLAWILCLHFLGDFVLQTRWMAENKSSNWKALGAHVGILWLVFFFGTIPLSIGESFLFATINSAIHALIDRFIWRGYKYYRRDTDPSFAYWKDDAFWMVLGFDQLLHGLTLVALAGWLGR